MLTQVSLVKWKLLCWIVHSTVAMSAHDECKQQQVTSTASGIGGAPAAAGCVCGLAHAATEVQHRVSDLARTGQWAMVTCAKAGQCICIGSTHSLALAGNAYTIEAWVRIHKYAAAGKRIQTLVSTHCHGGAPTLVAGLVRGSIYFDHGGFASEDGAVVAATPLPTGEWHHLAFVYDKSMKQQLIFLDAKRVARGSNREPLQKDLAVSIGGPLGERCATTLCRFTK